jgi:hypothetical protein
MVAILITFRKGECEMKSHVTIIGIIRIGLSAIWLFSGCLVFFILWGIGLGVGSEDPNALTVLGTIGSLVGVLLLIFSIPGIITGIGLLKYKNWARYLALLLAVFDLFNVPIGTAFGIYTFWALIQDETVALFEGENMETVEDVLEVESVEHE